MVDMTCMLSPTAGEKQRIAEREREGETDRQRDREENTSRRRVIRHMLLPMCAWPGMELVHHGL